MCGITGFLGISNENLLRKMCDSLTHRGPDDAGYFNAPGIGLAMRRLAIIDLNTGHQPLSNETKDIWVVFNGEIYNYDELRKELLRKGHEFSTQSDTETIVHLYEEEGLEFVNRLRGMFGIAIWDSTKRNLILARDRIGEKPLFYSAEKNRLLFGSEIKAILQAKTEREVDPQAVCEFLASGYVVAPGTFYQGISKLSPGQLMVCSESDFSTQFYWQHQFKNQINIHFSQAVEEVSERLNEAVKICLKSDVKVGAFLSGGVDSSVLVALMQKHNAEIDTFSVGYEGDATGFNELSYAKRVADYIGTQHHELILGPQSSMELLPQILWHYDEPHGEPTSVLVNLLCKFTREKVKVAIGGTGGDEIFFGYPRHTGLRYLEYYRLFPKIVRKNLIEKVISRWPESTKGSRFAKRAKRFIHGADLPPGGAYLNWVSLLSRDIREELIAQQIRSAAPSPSGETFLRRYLQEPGDISIYQRVSALEILGYLPEYQLTYMDRMSMANGLEVRSPLCDFEFVEYITSLPTSYRIRGTRTKHIFKEVAKKWIPREIVERKKVGFDSPIGQWFKGALKNFLTTFLSPEHIANSGLLDAKKVQGLIQDHLSNRKDYSMQLWSLVALEGWYRMYIEDRVTELNNYKSTDLRGVSSKTST